MPTYNASPSVEEALEEKAKPSAPLAPPRLESVPEAKLKLKAGDWVEVRGREEILSTLDEAGNLDSLPFMPEMFRYCGLRFRVDKRADKTCETVSGWSMRRMENTVLLERVRCDGTAHAGCEARCLIFWKESWLKRGRRK